MLNNVPYIHVGSVENRGLRLLFSTLTLGPCMVNEWKNITDPSRIYSRARLHCAAANIAHNTHERVLQKYMPSDIILHQKGTKDHFRCRVKAPLS